MRLFGFVFAFVLGEFLRCFIFIFCVCSNFWTDLRFTLTQIRRFLRFVIYSDLLLRFSLLICCDLRVVRFGGEDDDDDDDEKMKLDENDEKM